jgi:hypothetical protein
MAITLVKFTGETLTAARARWLEKATELEIPALDYEMIFDWAEKRIDYSASTGDSYAYCMFDSEANEAVAVVDIVYSRRPGRDIGWLKMLSIKLSPWFAPSQIETDSERLKRALDIYAAATLGTVELTGHHTARVVKLYGRNDSLLRLLLALFERLTGLADGNFTAKMEGRWLVIST